MMGPHGKEKNYKRRQKALLRRKRTLKTIAEEAADRAEEKNRRKTLKTIAEEAVDRVGERNKRRKTLRAIAEEKNRRKTLKTIAEEAADRVEEKNERYYDAMDGAIEDERYYDAMDGAMEEVQTKDNHIEKEGTQIRTKVDKEIAGKVGEKNKRKRTLKTITEEKNKRRKTLRTKVDEEGASKVREKNKRLDYEFGKEVEPYFVEAMQGADDLDYVEPYMRKEMKDVILQIEKECKKGSSIAKMKSTFENWLKKLKNATKELLQKIKKIFDKLFKGIQKVWNKVFGKKKEEKADPIYEKMYPKNPSKRKVAPKRNKVDKKMKKPSKEKVTPEKENVNKDEKMKNPTKEIK